MTEEVATIEAYPISSVLLDEIAGSYQFTSVDIAKVFEKGWCEKGSDNSPKYALAFDGRSIGLMAQVPRAPWYNSKVKPGSVDQEIWHWDVFELFVANQEPAAIQQMSDANPGQALNIPYGEVNISPNGAVWSARFFGERKREFLINTSAWKWTSTVGANSWQAGAVVPLTDLLGKYDPKKPLLVSVCFILGQGGDNEREYFKVAGRREKDNEPPDFHRVSGFLPLTMKARSVAY